MIIIPENMEIVKIRAPMILPDLGVFGISSALEDWLVAFVVFMLISKLAPTNCLKSRKEETVKVAITHSANKILFM